ncbi:MAG: type II toxin-antitoxin system HicB family antitoxin [Nitrospirae bacterium]|nr:type II toxin-antitoxin system HicB family antitoxin [Nitrospirota bacterium]
MKIKVVVRKAEEGGFWAEVPSIPGCFTQGDTWEELLKNIYEAIEACLSVDTKENIKAGRKERISVSVHGNRDLKIGMLKAIMKIAEIDGSEL